jgi:putative membrane protein
MKCARARRPGCAWEDYASRIAPQRSPGEDAVDATRRTRLANERTYLAWWRTGLSAFAVSLGAGKIVPALTKEPRWPYTAIGIGFALLGVVLVAYGLVRQRAVEAAISRGEYAPPDEHIVLVLAASGIVLGLALTAIVVFSG